MSREEGGRGEEPPLFLLCPVREKRKGLKEGGEPYYFSSKGRAFRVEGGRKRGGGGLFFREGKGGRDLLMKKGRPGSRVQGKEKKGSFH